MGTLVETLFSRYTFSEAEDQAAVTLSTLQRQSLINERTTWAEQKSQLVVDYTAPDPPQKFLLDHAYHAGAIDAINHILTIAENTNEEIAAQIEESMRAGLEKQYESRLQEMMEEFRNANSGQQQSENGE